MSYPAQRPARLGRIALAAGLAFALAAAGACSSERADDAPPAYPEGRNEAPAGGAGAAGGPGSTAGEAGTTPSAATGTTTAQPRAALLERAVGRIFGAPLPEGLELIERTDDVARFRSEATLAQLTDFYRRELRSHRSDVRTRGVEFTAQRGNEPDIFVLDIDGDREVVYFRPGLDSEVASAVQEMERTLAPQVANPGAAAARTPWPQGPVRRGTPPPAADQERGTTTDSGLYEERIEVINGEEVRVLVPRRGANPGSEGSQRRGAGSNPDVRYTYERPDGQRAMTRTPATDRQGNPLRFGGSVEVEVPENAIY